MRLSKKETNALHSLLQHLHGSGLGLFLLTFFAVKLIRSVHGVEWQNM